MGLFNYLLMVEAHIVNNVKLTSAAIPANLLISMLTKKLTAKTHMPGSVSRENTNAIGIMAGRVSPTKIYQIKHAELPASRTPCK